ncbi:MAG: hypothetical protein JXB10_09835 [Pirellulales bacterium]|nr:hypothetical protein [Pirellulales bacterium]
MQKALCIFGMVVAVLILLIFGLDLITDYPFHGSLKWTMDLPMVICALLIGYLGWSTLREQD